MPRPGNQPAIDFLAALEANTAMTIPSILELSAEKYGSAECLGTRELLERTVIEENGKLTEKLTLGGYSFLTYRETQEMVVKFSRGLNAIRRGKHDKVAFFAETRADWIIAALGCFYQGLVVVTVYTTLSNSNIVTSLQEVGVNLLITSYELLPRVWKVLPELPNIKQLVVMEDQLEGAGTVPDEFKYLHVTPFQHVLRIGETCRGSLKKPKTEDLAVIMYTSGSSGRPKGVLLSHHNIVYSVMSFCMKVSFGLGDRYLAFLPVAHVYEFTTEFGLLAMGVAIYFGSMKTMTGKSPMIKEGTLGDAQVAMPTYMNAVPLVLNRIITSVNQASIERGFFKQKIFQAALSIGRRETTPRFVNNMLSALVFKYA